MTSRTNARTAGFTFLLYIGVGISGMAGLAPDPRARVLMNLVECFSAIVLAVTLYGLTRTQDPDVATLGLVCRVAEGVLGAMFIPWGLAMPASGVGAAPTFDAQVAHSLDAIRGSAGNWNALLTATFFAVGSTAFCWLLLRGRLIPVALAWIGVGASVLLVICLPLQLARILSGPLTMLMWLPMLAFEVPAGVWLLAKGVRADSSTRL